MKAVRYGVIALALAAAGPAIGQTLSTGSGDGSLNVTVSGDGGFYGATYDPIGAGLPASTTYSSGLYYRLTARAGDRASPVWP